MISTFKRMSVYWKKHSLVEFFSFALQISRLIVVVKISQKIMKTHRCLSSCTLQWMCSCQGWLVNNYVKILGKFSSAAHERKWLAVSNIFGNSSDGYERLESLVFQDMLKDDHTTCCLHIINRLVPQRWDSNRKTPTSDICFREQE